MDRPRTSFDITRAEMAALRALAVRLGYLTSRGPGAGELGNITRLLGALAAAYQRDPEGTTSAMRELLGQASQEGKAAA